MATRYFPILRWKRGERVGLEHLSAAGKQDTTPLFVLGADNFRAKKATKKHPAIASADAFVHTLLKSWGDAPFYLDASRLDGQPHPLISIAASARHHGAQLIPATMLDAPQAYHQAVQTVAKADKRGAALSVDLQELTSIATWISQWPLNLNDTDLIADFNVNVATVANLGASLDHAFQNLHKGTKWRSVSVAGTSMPMNFTGYVAGTHTIRRAEQDLWRRLSSLGLPYSVHYGDYTSVPPVAPPPGIAWGYPINVRYTLKDEFLVCRGVRTTGPNGVDMGPQLIGHAKQIVSYASRGALLHCWGDQTIDSIAAGAKPQGLEHWVQIGVNRHVELIRSLLP